MVNSNELIGTTVYMMQ